MQTLEQLVLHVCNAFEQRECFLVRAGMVWIDSLDATIVNVLKGFVET